VAGAAVGRNRQILSVLDHGISFELRGCASSSGHDGYRDADQARAKAMTEVTHDAPRLS
jgi:hypothetical protein